MKKELSFEDLVEMPFFEGLAALALARRGDLTLMVGERPAGADQVEKMVDEIVRMLRPEEPVPVSA
ncbi:hypothetical protein E2N92_08410 [Methanofollis formosanus]|uniref:Uncharacterized protein n=1 Tax=Methanofollis formosanus TaxID=299308 RepID=A0A8G1A304_9EURY|nr:hypothetical protein [Methanofollis formosanus]QYZ79449.1 hypothetical protein E2N92_08410 [Methanofollis formosanus]